MSDKITILTEKRYYGSAFIPSNNTHNPFESYNEPIQLCTCATEGCNKQETIDKRFSRCTKCLTRYCSRECQIKDHRSGLHKDKCSSFSIVKEKLEHIYCTHCWNSKWKEVTDPDNTISKGIIHKSCDKCTRRRYVIEDSLPSNIKDDLDIQRVWFN